MRETTLWATGDIDASIADRAVAAATHVPGAGGTRFLVLTIPPDAVFEGRDFDADAARAEQWRHAPDLVERFERETPGMHTTPTTDYIIVLDGTVWLDLDDGAPVRLEVGDVVVQDGTRHAWRNVASGPATMAVVMVGKEQ